MKFERRDHIDILHIFSNDFFEKKNLKTVIIHAHTKVHQWSKPICDERKKTSEMCVYYSSSINKLFSLYLKQREAGRF